MPTFNADVTVNAEVDFEVFCSCGAGLCGQSETRSSRNRGTPQVVVTPCERCLEDAADKARDDEREKLEARIAELECELACHE